MPKQYVTSFLGGKFAPRSNDTQERQVAQIFAAGLWISRQQLDHCSTMARSVAGEAKQWSSR
jgi:hypothetical protein